MASGAIGLWAGWDQSIALRADGTWLRLLPRPGWRVWVASDGLLLVFDGAGWIGTFTRVSLPVATEPDGDSNHQWDK